MIKELSDGLKQFVDNLASRPLSTLAALALVILVYIGYRSYTKLEELLLPPKFEANRFETQLKVTELVNKAITNLRDDLGGENVVIRQFHNGRHDLTGIPFTWSSTTFYTQGYEGSYEDPISAYDKSLRLIWKSYDKPQCVVINKGIDIVTQKYFESFEINRVVICPLVNILNYPIGTIKVGVSPRSTLSDEVLLHRTEDVAKRVAGYLENGSN